MEKSTNGDDADVAPGPSIAVGAQVDWVYAVTNTGNLRLDNVTVTDDKVGSITCPGDQGRGISIGPGASVTCGASGVATLGQYENTATAVGLDMTQSLLTDTDPSHYFGYVSAVELEKSHER